MLLLRATFLVMSVLAAALSGAALAAAQTVIVSPPEGTIPPPIPECMVGYGAFWPHVDWDCCKDPPSDVYLLAIWGFATLSCKGHYEVDICLPCILPPST